MTWRSAGAAVAIAALVVSACTIEQDLTPRIEAADARPASPSPSPLPSEPSPIPEPDTTPEPEPSASPEPEPTVTTTQPPPPSPRPSPTAPTAPPPPPPSPSPTSPPPSPPPSPSPPAPGNRAPRAVDDSASVDEDSGTTSIPVLANDSDPDGDPFRITAVTQPSVGTVTFTDGAVSFTPNADANGMATFTYTVSDPGGATDRAIVSVTVRPINDAPVAADDQLTVTEDSGGTVTNVVANDRDVDGDTLTITAVTQPKKGKVTFSGHNVSFTPNADANGSDSFTYTVSDGNGASDTATVAVTITPVDDPPVALNDSMTIRKGYEQRDVFFNVISGTQGGGWTGSDSFNGGRDRDVDGDAMSYVGPANPSSGVTGVAVQCASHGLCQVRTLNYVCGTFTFSWTYRVQAGGATSNFATVTVRVEAQSCIT